MAIYLLQDIRTNGDFVSRRIKMQNWNLDDLIIACLDARRNIFGVG
jgi:hypothetical protein